MFLTADMRYALKLNIVIRGLYLDSLQGIVHKLFRNSMRSIDNNQIGTCCGYYSADETMKMQCKIYKNKSCHVFNQREV